MRCFSDGCAFGPGDRYTSIELPLIGSKCLAVMDYPFGMSSNMDPAVLPANFRAGVLDVSLTATTARSTHTDALTRTSIRMCPSTSGGWCFGSEPAARLQYSHATPNPLPICTHTTTRYELMSVVERWQVVAPGLSMVCSCMGLNVCGPGPSSRRPPPWGTTPSSFLRMWTGVWVTALSLPPAR